MIHEKKFFSKKGERKVTSFMGQELLYDYMSGQLDQERVKAVEEYLQHNRESQNDIHKIQVGLDYTDLMSQTKVSDALLQKIQVPDNYVENVVNKLKIEQWPAPVKMGVEASLIAIAITIIAVLIPWNKILESSNQPNNVTLTEINKSPLPQPGEDAPLVAAKRQEGEVQFQDEVSTKETKTKTAEVKSPLTTVKAVTQVAAPQNTPPPTTATKPGAATVAAVSAPESATENSESKKSMGFLYRGTIKISKAICCTSSPCKDLIGCMNENGAG